MPASFLFFHVCVFVCPLHLQQLSTLNLHIKRYSPQGATTWLSPTSHAPLSMLLFIILQPLLLLLLLPLTELTTLLNWHHLPVFVAPDLLLPMTEL